MTIAFFQSNNKAVSQEARASKPHEDKSISLLIKDNYIGILCIVYIFINIHMNYDYMNNGSPSV